MISRSNAGPTAMPSPASEHGEPVTAARSKPHADDGSPETSDLVVCDRPRPGVVLIQLNRPTALNALSPDMMAALLAELQRLDSDTTVNAVVIAGHDRAFVAGADIRSMQNRPLHDVLTSPTAQFWFKLAALEVVLVAAVSGPAFGGGCELALACDLIVASETATFAQAEIKVGIMPGGGGTQRLARTIGRQRAMEMVLTGAPIDAHEAHRLGLVNRVVAADRWRDEAVELASSIAAGPPLAIRNAKRAVQQAAETTLSAGMAAERRLFEVTFGTIDRVEGMTSFLEHRAPRWQGQ